MRSRQLHELASSLTPSFEIRCLGVFIAHFLRLLFLRPSTTVRWKKKGTIRANVKLIIDRIEIDKTNSVFTRKYKRPI